MDFIYDLESSVYWKDVLDILEKAFNLKEGIIEYYTPEEPLNESESPVELCDWNGKGIIVKICIPPHGVKLERVALLDSARAYVIVGINELNDPSAICIGGKTSKILFFQTKAEPDEADVRKFMDEVEASFSNDHLGSPAYKRQLISSLLQEMTVVK